MKRGTSATSRLGLFYSNHSDSSHRSHPQATLVWLSVDHHRWFFIGQSGLLISTPHSSPGCSGAAGWMKRTRIYGSLPS